MHPDAAVINDAFEPVQWIDWWMCSCIGTDKWIAIPPASFYLWIKGGEDGKEEGGHADGLRRRRGALPNVQRKEAVKWHAYKTGSGSSKEWRSADFNRWYGVKVKGSPLFASLLSFSGSLVSQILWQSRNDLVAEQKTKNFSISTEVISRLP